MYLKWVRSLKKITPNYILLEETKRYEICIETVKNEERNMRKVDKELGNECIREMNKKKNNERERKMGK